MKGFVIEDEGLGIGEWMIFVEQFFLGLNLWVLFNICIAFSGTRIHKMDEDEWCLKFQLKKWLFIFN